MTNIFMRKLLLPFLALLPLLSPYRIDYSHYQTVTKCAPDAIAKTLDGHPVKIIRSCGWEIPKPIGEELIERKEDSASGVTCEIYKVIDGQVFPHPLGGNSYMVIKRVRKYSVKELNYAIVIDYGCASKEKSNGVERLDLAGCVSNVLFLDNDCNGTFETLVLDHSFELTPTPPKIILEK